jgi:curved DNA-binding protein CbpA
LNNFIDLYQVLGVPFNATEEQVKKAYRKKAKMFHPDTGGTQEEFILIKTAYEILSDKHRRSHYDELYIQFQTYKQKQSRNYQQNEGRYGENESVNQNNDLNKEEKTEYKNEINYSNKNSWKYTGIFSITLNAILILILSIGLYNFLGKNVAIHNLISGLEEADKQIITMEQENKKLIEELEQMDRQIITLQSLNNELEELNTKNKEHSQEPQEGLNSENSTEYIATTITESKKEEYLQKLNNIEKGLIDLEYLYENGITSEMIEAESETYRRWDHALNEIYTVLKNQLSSDEMNKLRQEQRQWITNRDNVAETESLEFNGGTMELLQYISTQARLTKERCFELVQDYMQ